MWDEDVCGLDWHQVLNENNYGYPEGRKSRQGCVQMDQVEQAHWWKTVCCKGFLLLFSFGLDVKTQRSKHWKPISGGT